MAQGIDPVGNSYVESLARPGGNTTGFIQFEYSLAGKWMELLKEVAPGVTRVGVLREPAAAAIGQWAMIQAVAQSLGAELKPIDSRNADELERSITAFARAPNGGLIVAVSAAARTHRDLIITLAARYRLPTVYAYRVFVTYGGLITYGPDIPSQYRRAAGYVDRILKGEKPADLPVQAPTKYELVINLKTAKALGLEVPPTLLARADGWGRASWPKHQCGRTGHGSFWASSDRRARTGTHTVMAHTRAPPAAAGRCACPSRPR
jgi:putative tryptophan/tyrosine transport system substrate-binding protein